MSSEAADTSFRVGRETFFFVLLLAAAAAVYLFRLGYSDIWIDESLTKAIVRHALPDLLRLVAHDSHPPLYFIALRGFTAIVGNTDFTIRLFSVVGALAMLVINHVLGRRVFGPRVALWLGVLLLALPMPGLYSHVARMYTWAAFAVLGVFLCATLHAREGRFSTLAGLGLFSLMAAYLHYFSLIAAFWIDGALLIQFLVRRDRRWRGVAVMGLAVAVAYLPWVLVLRRQAETVGKDFWIPPLSREGVLSCYVFPFGGFYRLYGVSWILALVIYGLALAAVVVAFGTDRQDDRRAIVFALVGFHATVITAAVVSLVFRPVLYPRYLMAVVPLLMVPPVVLMARWRARCLAVAATAGLLACGLFVVHAEASFSFGPNQLALRTLARTHPEVVKVLHLNEVTGGPFAEYGRAGPWKQYYLNNAGTSWYSNMDAFDNMVPVGDLGAMVDNGEVFCVVEFAGLSLNGQNMELITSRSEPLAIEEIRDEKSPGGVVLKLNILKARF